jgi:hypothetical protein
VAQVLALATMLLGLQFLMNTTGGTLFVFASFGPLLVTTAILILTPLQPIASRIRRARRARLACRSIE